MCRGLGEWVVGELCRLGRRWWVVSVLVACGWWLVDGTMVGCVGIGGVWVVGLVRCEVLAV